ncbi:hypothetical protein AVEN_215889-1 [Araneus ventricosus]|uniref:Uncharacterized protein n=1 Tax=Araneus ventricosus TaxID=182803 RepID=A0A4Y2HGR0_ARAVE|nr:hypothetical protein AVEN_215889-1 [Araneus ventricosus]
MASYCYHERDAVEIEIFTACKSHPVICGLLRCICKAFGKVELGLGRYAVFPYQIHVDTDTRLYPINLLDTFVSDTAGNRSITLWNLERNSRSRQSGTDTRVCFEDTTPSRLRGRNN